MVANRQSGVVTMNSSCSGLLLNHKIRNCSAVLNRITLLPVKLENNLAAHGKM